jgi:RNA polymerase sigma-70 factor (ECF subfamily)
MSLDLAGCADGELAALALAGRQPAYGELMRRHRDFVYRLVRGQIGDADAALDVTQASFIAAFAALGRYDPARPFHVWVARIAINKCHDWARRRAVRRFFAFALPIEAAATTADDTVPADDQLAVTQELDRTMAAITALPARLKEALVLVAIEGMAQAEAAEILGVSAKTIETRIYRARARLKEMLRD